MSLPATRVNRSQQYLDPFREFDTVLNHFFGAVPVSRNGSSVASYPVDVREEGDHLVVEAELPGFSKEEVDVTIEKQVLTITAERKVSSERPAADAQPAAAEGEKSANLPASAGYLLRERRYTKLQRSFTLPDTIDDQAVEAKLENGILTLTLNKRPEIKPRKIQIG